MPGGKQEEDMFSDLNINHNIEQRQLQEFNDGDQIGDQLSDYQKEMMRSSMNFNTPYFNKDNQKLTQTLDKDQKQALLGYADQSNAQSSMNKTQSQFNHTITKNSYDDRDESSCAANELH